MKQFLIVLLAAVVVLTGCSDHTDPPAPTSSIPTATDVSSQPVSSSEANPIDIPIHDDWTWNELYDFLENPRKSGNLSFDEDKGESIELFDTDGITSLKNRWNTPLKQNMVVVKYNEAGEILCRYRVNLTGNTSSHQEIPSMVPSRTPSAPAVSTPDTASKPEEKQLLTFYITGEDALLEKAVAAFNQQSETVEILPVKLSQTMTADQLAKLKKENNCPDLVLMTHSEMTLAAADQQLANLSSLGLSKWNNKIDPTFLEKTQIGKATYGIPLGGVTSCLACNDELLYRAKAGVPATYEELIANAKLLRDTLPGVTPIGLTTDIADSRSMAEEFSMLLSGYGGALFTPDYESAAFYSQGGIHALAQLKTLQEEKLIADYVVRKDFYNEKIGYGIASSADYAKTFGKQAKANYTAAPLVMPGGGEAASYMELYSFCIPAGTSKAVRKAAFSFITYYFENPQYSVDLCQKKGWVPALLQAQTDESYNTPEWQVFIDTAKTARVIPPIACYPTIESYLAECVSSVLSGTDPETALEKAWNKTENRLARK